MSCNVGKYCNDETRDDPAKKRNENRARTNAAEENGNSMEPVHNSIVVTETTNGRVSTSLLGPTTVNPTGRRGHNPNDAICVVMIASFVAPRLAWAPLLPGSGPFVLDDR